MSSENDEQPSCQEVYSDPRLSRVCTLLCTLYRKDRPAKDDRHCLRQILALDGNLNHCIRTRSNLQESCLWVDKNQKGATTS